VRANGSGAFEASWIIDGGFESKCRNRANAWNSHHPQADVIIAGRACDFANFAEWELHRVACRLSAADNFASAGRQISSKCPVTL